MRASLAESADRRAAVTASNVVPLRTHDGFRCSGGELPHGSSDVWAMGIFFSGGGPTSTAHFFVRKSAGHVALCGYAGPLTIPRSGQNALFGAGSFPKCKRCMDALRPGRHR